MGTKLKPYNDNAGYVASLRRGPLQADGRRGWVVIYDAPKADMCAEAGRWTVVCETHATCVGVASLRAARSVMKSGSHEFCDACRSKGGA